MGSGRDQFGYRMCKGRVGVDMEYYLGINLDLEEKGHE